MREEKDAPYRQQYICQIFDDNINDTFFISADPTE